MKRLRQARTPSAVVATDPTRPRSSLPFFRKFPATFFLFVGRRTGVRYQFEKYGPGSPAAASDYYTGQEGVCRFSAIRAETSVAAQASFAVG